MKNEIEFTKNMYEEADGGIALLNPQGRKAVQRASILYSSILDKIASVNYDVFTANVRSSKRENLLIIIKKNISALRLNCCLQ
jgi:phytoene synthase